MISNRRFREAYTFMDFGDKTDHGEGTAKFASVHDITVRNIYVYADEGIISKFGKDCLKVEIINTIPTTVYDNIRVENIYLNGEKVTEADFRKTFNGVEKSVLMVK